MSFVWMNSFFNESTLRGCATKMMVHGSFLGSTGSIYPPFAPSPFGPSSFGQVGPLLASIGHGGYSKGGYKKFQERVPPYFDNWEIQSKIIEPLNILY